MITLITGGVKSGKSSFALKLSENFKKRHLLQLVLLLMKR
ncbi:bifunctional adenosylcobalamin biosynthesis protein CobP [Thermosipho africanus H17ap60334]|nr:bifunctional adenosylcobalamin biosynthesis protein CobP [Thermosipho africanus H17ap60334]